MKIKLLVIGKLKEKAYRDRINEYIKWINKDIPIELIFLKDSTENKISKKLRSHITHQDHVICVSEEGGKQSSIGFSEFIFDITRNLIFIVGGADGHPKDIKEKANQILSLSKMTFPHEMALLILTEQIYRAITIKKGSKYHR
ncbi:MAG: 23S rRNA (pseudouridine(1915)-N(3))-methyltransferase RlmH [Candidatus Marinimicrobia bacterium]|nr:23S rRNA (pseudouridine(1915)-N(3))-methyltransferase RlmH [Candidatus Neomarinimicrobiota bacterium]